MPSQSSFAKGCSINSTPKFIWNWQAGTGRTATAITVYNQSTGTLTVISSTTDPVKIANNINYNKPGSCDANANLNAGCAAPPTANSGGPYSSCGSRQLNGFVGGSATGGVWSTSNGTGSFTPGATTLNAIYNPSVNDFSLSEKIISMLQNVIFL